MKTQTLNLLKKEFVLGNSLQSIIWSICCLAMYFIPSYPMYVGPFYITLCIFMTFALNQSTHDILYTVLLPVKKTDVVRARFLYCGMMEFFAILSALLACLIKNLAGFPENKAGIDLTISFFGLLMIEFSIFNLIFLGNVYKNPLKSGLRFILAAIIYFIMYAAFDFPVWTYRACVKKIADGELQELNIIAKLGHIFTGQNDSILLQLCVLLLGLVIYVLTWLLTFRRAAKQFEKYNM